MWCLRRGGLPPGRCYRCCPSVPCAVELSPSAPPQFPICVLKVWRAAEGEDLSPTADWYSNSILVFWPLEHIYVEYFSHISMYSRAASALPK